MTSNAGLIHTKLGALPFSLIAAALHVRHIEALGALATTFAGALIVDASLLDTSHRRIPAALHVAGLEMGGAGTPD